MNISTPFTLHASPVEAVGSNEQATACRGVYHTNSGTLDTGWTNDVKRETRDTMKRFLSQLAPPPFFHTRLIPLTMWLTNESCVQRDTSTPADLGFVTVTNWPRTTLRWSARDWKRSDWTRQRGAPYIHKYVGVRRLKNCLTLNLNCLDKACEKNRFTFTVSQVCLQ